MNTYLPGFQSFFMFLHHFVLAKIATSSIRVKVHFVHLGFFLLAMNDSPVHGLTWCFRLSGRCLGTCQLVHSSMSFSNLLRSTDHLS